jgi:hypothetical protein
LSPCVRAHAYRLVFTNKLVPARFTPWPSWPKSRPEPASSCDGVRSGDHWALRAPWARAGSTHHQEGRSPPRKSVWRALPRHTARPASPPRLRVRQPSLPLSCGTTWSSPWPSVTMVDDRASRTVSGAMRVASPVWRRVSPDCRRVSTRPPRNARHPRALRRPPEFVSVDLQYLYYKFAFEVLMKSKNPARNEREKCPKAELQTPGSNSGLERP